MLYTIGDLHLSFETSKPMDIFGDVWTDHVTKIEKGFSELTEADICVICGDLTWGIDMKECLEDFKFINNLPGKKIILKGNHDFWWSTVTAAKRFFSENGIDTIDILNNNAFFYDDIAICGTRGWMCNPDKQTEHDKKIMSREVQRLETSLKAAGDFGRKICFLHYPPIYGRFRFRELLELMTDYGVEECYYGHIHGKGCLGAIEGEVSGIRYKLISADNVGFKPVKIG